MKIAKLVLISTLALSMGAGCSSTKSTSGSRRVWTPQANARNLSRETLAQVLDYEEVIQQVSKTYSDYSRVSLADLESSVVNQADTVVRQQRDLLARESAEKALAHGLQPSEFREFVLAYQDAGKQAESRLMEAYSAIEERDRTHRAKLDSLQKSLKATRDKLDKLQTEPSGKDHIEEFRAYYQMARDAYDQSNKKASR